MPREFSRNQRVGAELHRLLNELMQTEVKDPRLAGVRINDVELSRDLGVAKIYYGTLDPDQPTESVEEAFAHAGGFLRSRAGTALRLRRVPELRFIHDISAERGFELSRLIASTGPGTEPESSED